MNKTFPLTIEICLVILLEPLSNSWLVVTPMVATPSSSVTSAISSSP